MNYTQKTYSFQAMQYDGTETSAIAISAWIATVPGGKCYERRVGGKYINCVLFVGTDYKDLSKGDWVNFDPTIGYPTIMNNDLFQKLYVASK